MTLIRAFNISTYLTVVAGALSLAVAQESLAYTTIILTGVIASYFVVEEKKAFYLDERVKAPLTIIFLLFAVIDIFLLSRSFVMTLAHLLLLIQLTKLLEKKSDGDYLMLYLISVVLLVVAAVITVELYFFFFFISLVIFGSFALVLFQLRSQYLSDDISASTFLGVTIWPTVLVFIITSSLFFLIPRLGFGFLQRDLKGPSLTSGFSEEVELGAIGTIKEGYKVVMRIKPGDTVKHRPTPQLWRGIALTDYDGGKWRTNPDKNKKVRADKKGVITLKEIDGQNLDWQEVILNPMDSKVIFVPYQASSIQSNLPIIEMDDTSSLFSLDPPYRGREYLVYSSPEEKKQTFLASGEEVCLSLSRPFTKVRDLASRISQGTQGPWAKAKKIETYLKNNFTYTLKLSHSMQFDPVEEFLFKKKKGHCEFFASSMVIMLRTLNIPARLVNGFLVEEWNAFGGYYLVREKDAHSWVEAYIAGKGWVVFDPTPPQAGFWPFDILFPLIYQFYDYMELKWDSYVVAYNIWDQRRMVQYLLDTQNRFLTWVGSQLKSWVNRILQVEFSLITFLITTLTLFGSWLLYKVTRLLFSLKRAPAPTKFYLKLLTILAQKGYGRKRHQTPWEFAQQIMEMSGSKFAGVGFITQKYYQCRYGGYGLSREEQEQIDDLLKGLVIL